MTPERPPPSVQARGFLFADLRGYTAFAEARGDQAAASLLSAYRSVVRGVISRFGGAEIRTEGDSFYIVFPSSTDGIRAGLAILAEGARPPEGAPLRIGIGIHAGETTETAEGYVGSAVNVAARICAAAGPGELLVSDTVRILAKGQLDARFEPRGRKRLKGISEPVAVYAVTDVVAPITTRRLPAPLPRAARDRVGSRFAAAAALALSALILTAAAIVLLGRQLGGNAREQPTSAPGLATANAPAATMPAATTKAESDPAAEREASNDRLRARIDQDVARLCEDADLTDAPATAVPITGVRPQPLATVAGLKCEIGGSGPDVAYYWLAMQETERAGRQGMSSESSFFYVAGDRNLAEGDCSSDTRAWGSWSFGASGGLLLCSGFGGEALLMWTYEGTAIVAEATREDGDSERLYRWWLDHARVIGPEPPS